MKNIVMFLTISLGWRRFNQVSLTFWEKKELKISQGKWVQVPHMFPKGIWIICSKEVASPLLIKEVANDYLPKDCLRELPKDYIIFFIYS
jgi:hypothetical protein